MARYLKPPALLDLAPGERSIFLAGSIEMGRAEQWQAEVEHALGDLEVAVLNPRRDTWDTSWTQRKDDPRFRAQVEWELAGLELASVILFYFAPDTKAPISLLELGLHAKSNKALVCCPEGYWRRGNVEIVCGRHGIPLVTTLDDLIALAREKITQA